MDDILGRIASQTVTFAIRSGIGVASSFAIGQCHRYIKSIKGSDRSELISLQTRLETKIKIISPAIDLVDIIAARGNTSLEYAVVLTKALRKDIQSLGIRLQDAANTEERTKSKKKGHSNYDAEELKKITMEIKDMLRRIEDAVPLISLAVTTSGVTLSTQMPKSVSPSRLLQASTLLTTGDGMYQQSPFETMQIGTSFTLTMYGLFAGHAHRTVEDLTWQEVATKCRVKLLRVPLQYGGDTGEGFEDGAEHYMRGAEKIDEYAYELRIIEDLDDGRIHEDEGELFDDVAKSGRRLSIPIHQISKIFYTNSGKLLGIDAAAPILLIKRNENAPPPRRLIERIARYEISDSEDEDSQLDGPSEQLQRSMMSDADSSIMGIADPRKFAFPKHLDKEWLAFEVWTESVDDDDDDDVDESDSQPQQQHQRTPPPPQRQQSSSSITSLIPGMTSLLRPKSPNSPHTPVPSSPPEINNSVAQQQQATDIQLSSINVKSSLSLLECLLRLTGLQNHQQSSHLSVTDELLNLFLSDSYGDDKTRKRERNQARKKLGFDPYGTPAPGTTAAANQQQRRKVVRMDEDTLALTEHTADDEYDDDYDDDDGESSWHDDGESSRYLLPYQQSSGGGGGGGGGGGNRSQMHMMQQKQQQQGRRKSSGSSSNLSPMSGPLFTSTPPGGSSGNNSSSKAGSAGTKGTSPMFSSPVTARRQQMGSGTPSKLRQEFGSPGQ